MSIFDKNCWLNFVIGLTGFYFVYSIMQVVIKRFGAQVVVTASGVNLSGGYLWLVSFGVALILSLVLLILFCKPRVPFFVFLGVLIAGILGLYHPLYVTVVNLDKNVRKDGLVALYDLLPHLVVFVGALIALYVAWLSNRMAGGSGSGTAE
ncbi:MAG TPA: hypothetical protein DDW65_04880 [Firmicutes bacterium]|jgi:hypothetical protein|nr:hypothetical protein [Bacillota bacterium]